jgi:predicted Zn-ribbon and HTH transcriptional regulator
MLKFFYQLFVVGFPPKKPDCEHIFREWKVLNAMSNSHGDQLLIQTRSCSHCGFTEIKKTRA